MRRSTLIIGIALAAFLGTFAVKTLLVRPSVDAEPEALGAVTPPATSYRRIVSLAPSTTELLFALGLGDRVVGVTRFCTYPPEAKSIAQIGGFSDPNYEAILALEPDLAVLLPLHVPHVEPLTALGIDCIVLDEGGIEEILDAITALGRKCGVSARASKLRAALGERIERVRKKVANSPRPRVLIVIGREYGAGSLVQVSIAGEKTFYNDLVEAAGGTNVYPGVTMAYPAVSAEGIIRLDPDIVLEMIPEGHGATEAERLLDAWRNTLPNLEAVKQNRVHIIQEDYVAVPGPRFVQLLEQAAALLHPEIDWSAP